jgi:polyhydroxyalkanoate synthesis regulator phasin
LKQTLKIGAMLLVVAALTMTGVALAQSEEDSVFDEATTDVSPLRDRIVGWLAPLVEDGTIDQSQAEAVADTLAEALPRPQGPMGRGLEAVRQAADFLGLSLEELGTALRDGETLAEIAAAQGSSAEALIDHLTGLAAEHLDELVADGRITAEQKADMLEHMTERITALVNGEIERPLMGGPGMGRGRHGRMGGGPCTDDGTGSEELGT